MFLIFVPFQLTFITRKLMIIAFRFPDPTFRKVMMQEFGRFELDGARGIARLSDTLVAVASRNTDSVIVYDITNGSKRFAVGEEERYQLRVPVDVAVTPSSILVLESSGTIVDFNTEGRFVGKFHFDRGRDGQSKPAYMYCIGTGGHGVIVVGAGNTLSTLSPVRDRLTRVNRLDVKPHYLDVCLKRDEVAISGDGYLEILDLSARKVRVKRSIPIVAGLCYSEDCDYLYVIQRQGPYGPGQVNKHDAFSGDLVACECEGLERPGGAVLVSEFTYTLAVADWNSVKTFTSW